MSHAQLLDPFGRRITYLRLSVTRRCAFRCTYCRARLESLPYPDESFDADISQFGLMFFNDRRGWLPVMGGNLDEHVITHILAEAEQVLAAYIGTDGKLRFDSPAHIVRARKH